MDAMTKTVQSFGDLKRQTGFANPAEANKGYQATGWVSQHLHNIGDLFASTNERGRLQG